MKTIILASASAQRKKLLKLAGLKFTVCPSRVQEITKIETTCASFVKKNALLKAEDIARKIDEGIVIAADTTVYGGNKRIIGKPKNLREAKRILKILFSRPHWVYTGVVVMDALTGKTYIDYEKTKVFMHKISDEEIDRYHQQTSPLDKAGGFDIEGRGGLFINRIEGCYSNVIGLPMAKLRTMLKKFGISILSLFLCINLFGCSSEFNLATGQEERLMYGTDKEVKIGDAVSKQIEANYEINTDVDVNERVQRILDRIVEVCDRVDIVYIIKVINEDKLNAVSLPGGYIYVFKGLIDKAENDDQIAGVIAHEVGHITARHGIKRLQTAYGYTLVQVAAVASGKGEVARGVNAMYTTMFLAHSRQDEFQSDKLAVKYMKKSGYDPKEMVKILQIMKREQDKDLRPISYFRTHPHLSQRMSVVNREISGKASFKDYLNLTGYEEDPH